MESFPHIETERLILSPLTASDIPAIVHHAATKRISEFTLNLPFPYSEKDAVYWLNLANLGSKNGTHRIFAIRQKAGETFIGGIGLTIEQRFNRAEIGYWLGEPFWNQGYMSEAMKAIIQFGFDHQRLHKLTASHFALNLASGKVMTKNGMTLEGELKDHILKESVYHTLMVYGLTQKDYNLIRD